MRPRVTITAMYPKQLPRRSRGGCDLEYASNEDRGLRTLLEQINKCPTEVAPRRPPIGYPRPELPARHSRSVCWSRAERLRDDRQRAEDAPGSNGRISHDFGRSVMPRRPAKVTQADIARAIRAAKEAGASAVTVDGDSVIRIILTASATAIKPANSLDEVWVQSEALQRYPERTESW